jgi:Uma2 family endonuclease
MSTATTLMTADDLWKLAHDGNLHELVKGELVTMPPGGFEHGDVGTNILVRMHNHVGANKLGKVVGPDTGFILEHDPDTVRAADVAFVGNAKLQQFGRPKKYFPTAPDAAVEVISPSDVYVEVDEKVEQWLQAGTQIVWVVNPRRKTVAVHVPGQNPVILKEADVLTGDPVLPGFSMPVTDIFA